MNQSEPRRGVLRGSEPRSAARAVLAAVRKFWLEYSSQGRVFAAISGGVDSMVMLEALHRALPNASERARLTVVHVNHGLRGEESDGDEAFVLERARQLGLAARSLRLDWGGEVASQERCRRRREDFFRQLCAEPGDRIWLAHHLNDQAETVFFRLLRGTGARGLRGILPVNGRKVRPLLRLEKAELLAAAGAWGVTWREDRSNADREAYERNWLRGFFPELEARRPGFQRKLAALAEEARGWRFEASPRFDRFPAAPGLAFTRFRAGPPEPRDLSAAFSLGRAHTLQLAGLLGRAQGSLDVAGARFSWSAGVLLWERKARFHATLRPAGAARFESELGTWELPAALALWPEPAGEGRKKEFQALRVPLFFRGGIPVVAFRGRPAVLLPGRIEGRLERPTGLSYVPSPLAAWWLEPGV